jgi:hypothetical protein
MDMQYLVKASHSKHKLIKCALTDHFVSHIMARIAFVYKQFIPSSVIIHSLKKVLSDFPVFAGVLCKKLNQLHIDCNNNGVEVRIVNHKKKLSDLQQIDQYKKLVKNPNATKLNVPVLYIQLNYCKDGMIIGYCWHHSIGDMTTFMAFLHALSNYAQGKSYSIPPLIVDREAYLQQFNHKNSIQENNDPLKMISFMDVLQFIKQKFSPRQKLCFHLPEDYITKLKTTVETNANTTLSKNNIICSFLLDNLKSSRFDEKNNFNSSIIINYRKRIGMSELALGNYLDVLSIAYKHNDNINTLALQFNEKLKKYVDERFNPTIVLNFLNKIGGFKNINKVLPYEFLPKNKNFVITSWLNFNIYSIDFGVIKPYLFLSLLNQPLPWTCSIVEGFENKGALVSVDLPSHIANKFREKLKLFEMNFSNP